MYEQLDIFSYLEPQKEHITFNPIEEFAKQGSGFVNGKKRIVDFFSENENLTDRANFLKKEYGEPFGNGRGSDWHIKLL